MGSKDTLEESGVEIQTPGSSPCLLLPTSIGRQKGSASANGRKAASPPYHSQHYRDLRAQIFTVNFEQNTLCRAQHTSLGGKYFLVANYAQNHHQFSHFNREINNALESKISDYSLLHLILS